MTDEGKAITTARVRCERIVAIRGADNMFKKSSVIVTKRVEVDLTCTKPRQNLWRVIRGVRTTIADDLDPQAAEVSKDSQLSKEDTNELYKKFNELAELVKASRAAN